MVEKLKALNNQLEGTVHFDALHQAIYATDASVYKEKPLAVAFPKNVLDIQALIQFAINNQTSLIPRTAGTSLAGQCVGSGIIVDVSKYMNQIVSVNKNKQEVVVQPGVIRDELNLFLKKDGLYFGPETSTANRAMMGGMVGNNSCGTNSIVYGNTRKHLKKVKALLSDGSEVIFEELNPEQFGAKTKLTTLEGQLYQSIYKQLSNDDIRQEITDEFPLPSIHRRNTGYAVDDLMKCTLFGQEPSLFNFCKLIAGSEGTLAFITEITLNCVPLPPAASLLLAAQFSSVEDALKAVLVAMEMNPSACELMDKVVMDCTKENIEYSQHRFFIEGDPEAVLLVEFRSEDLETIREQCNNLSKRLTAANLGYSYPIISQEKSKHVWQLRKAGLGLLANIPGDKKAVAVIEDTAVALKDLPNYIKDFTEMMQGFNQKAVYYAHAGAGELHLRPILNLKEEEDVQLFKDIAVATAKLVKRYKGSLSGEHGDGRVRASFLPLMVGEKNYALLKEIKNTWDPNNIFNPGKIIDADPIDSHLRYDSKQPAKQLPSYLDFSDAGGFLRMVEKCNGSGDCRKTALSGGTMCPSYMATKNEKDTTRARANVLREFLSSNDEERNNWNAKEVDEALALCLSCKGCKNECPSNVDMAALKAEYTYQQNKVNGTPLRSKLFGNVAKLNKIGSFLPRVTNLVNSLSLTKKLMGIAPERTPPPLAKQTLKKWFASSYKSRENAIKQVYFFADEFTNFLDVEAGKKAILLLHKLGYEVKLAPLSDSGRAFLSKGMLAEAKALANQNVKALIELINEDVPLLGIEPSAILSFRDEYIRLIDNKQYQDSCIVKNSLFIDEFLAKEFETGNIKPEQFSSEHKQIVFHGHCHQKAISKTSNSATALSIPLNYHVEVLPTGCCGMAGSFGYEQENYSVSQQIGELVLFPAVRNADDQAVICAPGTSCRHQISDGTGKAAHHTVEVLYDALV